MSKFAGVKNEMKQHMYVHILNVTCLNNEKN